LGETMSHRQPKQAPAPGHLSTEAGKWWSSIIREWELSDDPQALLLLQTALEAFDRVQEARRQIGADGAVVTGRYGPKAHPSLAIERDNRSLMIRSLKALNLDLEPLNDKPGRPGGE